ncbi:MAG: twin-arginine translocation signal domain-containing protein, partial [Candidatus Dadabacteria bacterium]
MCDKILSRRKFLRTLTAGTCAAAIHSALRPLGSDLVYAAPYSNHTLIHIFLSGGMDCASYLVPRGLSAYLDKRPTLGITNPLVLNSAFGLNPLMTNLHNLYQQGMVAFINKVGYPDATRSHEDSRRVYQQAMRIQGTDNRGWLGRFADIYVPRNQTFSLLSFSGSVRDLQSAYVPAVTTQGLDGYNYT